MKIPLSRSVVLSMMVVHVFAFVAHGAFILISIALGHTFVNVCTFGDGFNPASTTFSFYVAVLPHIVVP
jgi:hypothetical protein